VPSSSLPRKLAAAFRLHAPIHRVKTFLVYLGEKVTDSKARYWARAGEDAVRAYWESRNDASSRFLADHVRPLTPATILEVGCNCGNRLYRIAKERPDCRLVGIDISPLAVARGNEWLAAEKISNVELRRGRIEDLSELGDRSFDLVLTWAILIYIKPGAITQVLAGLLRVAKRHLVLLEMNGTEAADPSGLGTYHPPGNWKRDYRKILESLGVPGENIRIEPLPNGIWNPSGGGGAVIRVSL
jgi:hypothetical protein